MSTRRKGVPPSHTTTGYSRLAEMMASPDRPMPAEQIEARMRDQRFHLEQLAFGAAPTTANWAIVASAGNIIAMMLKLDMVQDEHGILAAAQDVLKSAAEHARKNGTLMRFVGAEVSIMTAMLDAYQDLLQTLPHRDVLRAFRETEKRARGPKRSGDYDANPAKHKD